MGSNMEYFELTGRSAWVTGAGSGLGRHFALLLARHGAQVIVAGRREAPLDDIAREIREGGGQCESCVLDVASKASVAAAAERMVTIDILVNNAGIVGAAPALALGDEEWDQVLDTNLTGMFLMAQTAARAMKAHGRGGSIVNIASILGVRQAGGVLAYAVSKAGVIQLSKQLALELARHRIRVNALAPGYIASDLNRDFLETEAGRALVARIPQRRLGKIEELDVPLLLLASDAGAYITGSVLAVDGGHLVSSL